MRPQILVISSAIRDTNTVTGNRLTIAGHKQIEFEVVNGLNQSVTIQILSINNQGNSVNLGSSFVVSAADNDTRVVTRETSGLFGAYRATAKCDVAPGSGTLTVYAYPELDD